MKKTNEHNVEYIKRLAKKIKKERSITHYQALDVVAVDVGFSNWKHFSQNVNENTNSMPSKDKVSVETLPESEKTNPYRNLLVAAVNALIASKNISLNPININPEQENGHVFLNLFEQPSVIIWRNIGFEELSISVWWKYNHNNHPQANLEGNRKENFNGSSPLAKKQHYKKFVGIVASCWLERRNGKYIQGENRECIFDIYSRKGELEILREMPTQKPNGYKTSGPFHL